MKHTSEGITFRSALKTLFFTFIFDTIIAVFLNAIEFADEFITIFIISQCIGLSCCSCVLLVHKFIENARPVYQAILVAVALVIGTMVGSYLGMGLSGLSSADLFEKHGLFQLLILGIMFGSIITYFFSSREQIAESQAQIQEEKIKRLTSEKVAAEANLKLLQAQIEPHFLFNTLSNVLSLLDTNPTKGKSMLVDFIQYLRASLSKIRQEKATLGQEMEMIEAYLSIFKVRMGDRLRYNIDLPQHLKSISFPPMLIQPLVENAIKHGLEPKVDGGGIQIRGIEKDGILRLEVVDSGMGLKGERESGMGLSNIRERLFSLYGKRGRLLLEENSPQGLKATIEVPHGKP
ncbi:Autolysin sensor kinase (EC [Olavius sp. associated proteobacterium Delta 1]|nr:Autolysin sensor kinase (EC [Olavius sp. associated proteobacterium Delta 1]